MSLMEYSAPTFDLQWDSTYDLPSHFAANTHDGRFRFSLRYTGAVRDDPTVEDLIGNLSVDPNLTDSRATWHRNYIPLAPWIRAHILKQAMGWNGETQLADHFEEHPELAVEYGFFDDDSMVGSETVLPNPPAQSRL